MKSTRTMMTLILVFLAAGPVLADGALDRTAALALVERLTSRGQETWIPAGTIIAHHQEYRAARTTDEAEISAEIERQLAEYRSNPGPEVSPRLRKMRLEAIPFNARYWMSNEYTMDTSVEVRYDGERFYWAIEVESRTDSVTVPSELRANELTEQFRLEWNQRRVFAWDGQDYTAYTDPVDHAMVDAGGTTMSTEVRGPLTAGLVPWGRGTLTYQSLSKANIAAASVARDGATQIEMAVERPDGSAMQFVLDPAKGYAVTSCSLPSQGGTLRQDRFFSGYRQIAGNWVPTTVLIEQRDAFTNRLLGSDTWDLTVVDTAVPGPEAFSVDYGADTVVEYRSAAAGVSATYNYSNATDTDRLLADRIAYVAAKSKKPVNCATAALKYAASQLGKTVPETVLARLVRADGQTSLHDLKQAAEKLGFHCRAVQTDIATLRGLSDCVAILHLPSKNHFVVLDRLDDRYAWLVDLASNRFHYRTAAELLRLDWTQGTALLLSNRPVKGRFRDLDNNALTSTVGAQEGGWSCTHLLQYEYSIVCTGSSEECSGYYRYYYERWGCEAAASGTCSETLWVRLMVIPCYTDPVVGCYGGQAVFYYMKACA